MDSKSKKKPGEAIFAGLLLLFSLFVLWQAYGIAGFESLSSPGAFPMAVASVMAVSSFVVLLKMLRLETQETIQFWHDILPPVISIITCFIVVFALVLEPIGFIPAAFVFLSCSVFVLRKTGLVYSLAISAGSLFVIYILFRLVFSVMMPEGIVPERELLAWFENIISSGLSQ